MKYRVEDDRDLNRQTSSALEAAGYAVDRAFDGEEGLVLGRNQPYDAVVLDIGRDARAVRHSGLRGEVLRWLASSTLHIAVGLIAAVAVSVAAYQADVVFAPLTLGLFIIALVWPLQDWLQQRMPALLALAITRKAV